METRDESKSEKVAMMDGANTPVIKSLCLADNPTIKRIRKILLIILSICIVLSAISLITMPLFGALAAPKETIEYGVQISQTLIVILFYSFGIFIVYRYHQTGLRVFGWLCIICLILLGIAIVVLFICVVIFLIYMNNTYHGEAAFAYESASFFSLPILMCLTAFIIKVVIVKFSFKLARLIADNKPSITEHV